MMNRDFPDRKWFRTLEEWLLYHSVEWASCLITQIEYGSIDDAADDDDGAHDLVYIAYVLGIELISAITSVCCGLPLDIESFSLVTMNIVWL